MRIRGSKNGNICSQYLKVLDKLNHEKMDDGTVVVSKIQTKGRGRGNRVWESGFGNLYFSFIIKKDISYQSLFETLSRVCVSITRILKKYNIQGSVKYPNDILVKNKKICGILIETYGNLELEGMIVGIGMNVNQQSFGVLDNKATSLSNESNGTFDLEQLLNSLIDECNQVFSETYDKIFVEYLSSSVVIGKEIDYDGKRYKIHSISKSGELLVSNKNETEILQLNEISLEGLYENN